MNGTFRERGLHLSADERQNVGEFENYNEKFSSSEKFTQQERQFDNREELNEDAGFENKKNKSKSSSLGAKELAKYLSTATVLIATTATVIIPVSSYIQSLPQVEIVSESVGCLSYSCALTLDGEEVELEAILQTPDGEIVDNFLLDGQIDAEARFEDLQPETEYQLKVFDNDGEERLVHEFETQPFVEIENLSGAGLKLTLHQEMSVFAESSIWLITVDGKDFSSNVSYSEKGEIYISNTGLYGGDYYIKAVCFLESVDGEINYYKPITLGGLQELKYSAQFRQNDAQITEQIAEITLSYQSGDIAPYTVKEIEVYYGDAWFRFLQDEFYIDDSNNITIPIYEFMENGEYQICVWGSTFVQDVERLNQIWLDNITVNFTGVN